MNLVKTFDCFEDGVKELVGFVPEVSKYIGNSTEEKEVIAHMLEFVKNDIPTVYHPDYPGTLAISVIAREVGFKTTGYLSFGWQIFFVGENKVTYNFRVTVHNRNKFAQLPKFLDVLKDNGWSQKDTNKNQTRLEQ